MTSTFLRFAITCLAAIGVASCTRATGGATTAPEPDSTRNAQLEAIYRARLDSARMRFTPADVQFMTSMIAHHAQAVVAARLAESHGASPSILTLSGRIINAQQDEIATMEQWLRDRRQPVPELHIEGTSVMMHGGTHVHMPGMLTAEQMRQLDEARSAEFDRLFLAYMIQHHRGAVTMVRELFSTDGAGQDEEVFKFASDVQVDQSTEVARMELMLAELSPTGRTP
jgi:uncharacterized protein (DUF305 family)